MSAVEAHAAGVLRRPVIRIGHQDPRFDGAPAMGRIDNLRITDNGQCLVGDFVDVPAAIAALLPHRYPSRSVEARTNVIDRDGREWSLVLTAVALLGSTAPGIDDLAELDTVAASGRRIVIASVTYGHTDPAVRARAVQVAAARRRRRSHRMIGVNT